MIKIIDSIDDRDGTYSLDGFDGHCVKDKRIETGAMVVNADSTPLLSRAMRWYCRTRVVVVVMIAKRM